MNLKAQRAAALKAAQDIAEAAKAAGIDLTEDEQTKISEHLDEVKALDEKIEAGAKSAALVSRLTSIKEPEPEHDGPVEGGQKSAAPRSIGERVVGSEAFRAFKAANPSGVSAGVPVHIDAKGVGGLADLGIGRKAALTSQIVGGGAYKETEPGYNSQLVADVPLTFLDLVTTGQTNVAYSEYRRVIAEVNNAAVVAESDLKPLSSVTTDTAESKAFVYADGFDVTNQTLADDGALVAFMDQRIRQHVRGVVEQKLFNGTGAGTQPQGILTATGTLAQVFDTDIVTSLARAIDKFETNNGETGLQAIVMHPTDIWTLRMLKGTDGHYLLGNPLQQGPIPTPWGVPLVRSNKLTVGTALVGRFDSVHFLELDPLNVLAFNQHKDYAQRNMSYVRAELRGRQLFYSPREVVVTTIKAA